MLVDGRDEAVDDRKIALNLSDLLHCATIELNAGRATAQRQVTVCVKGERAPW